jgi:hypothetical protein
MPAERARMLICSAVSHENDSASVKNADNVKRIVTSVTKDRALLASPQEHILALPLSRHLVLDRFAVVYYKTSVLEIGHIRNYLQFAKEVWHGD